MNLRTLFPCRFANLTLACFLAAGLAAPVCRAADPSDKRALPRLSIAEAGAVPDGVTRNTKAIQAAIDQPPARAAARSSSPQAASSRAQSSSSPASTCSLRRRGPAGLDEHRRLSADADPHRRAYPGLAPGLGQRGQGRPPPHHGRGHHSRRRQALLGCLPDPPQSRQEHQNLNVNRPRNLFVQDSNNVLIRGISLRESGFWNLHLYRCRDATVEKLDIRTPPGAPSTDGIDVNSCQNVTIRGCYISVDDDNIALKGSKGPFADQDLESPAIDHIRITDCTFAYGHGAVTVGSEACHVRDVVVENCRVEGTDKNNHNILVRLKLRPDTPSSMRTSISATSP